MKKIFSKKALCIALASVMIFGEAGTALAATGNYASQTPASVEANTASTETVTASIDSFDVDEYSDSIYVNANAVGMEATLYVNGKAVDTKKATVYTYYTNDDLYFNDSISTVAGGTYNVKLVVKGSGASDTKTAQKTIVKSGPSFDGSSMEISNSIDYTDTGYKALSCVYVEAYVSDGYDSYYGSYTCELYRSTSSKSKGKKIYSTTRSYGGYVCCYDYDAVPGTTYYYTMDLVAGADNYGNTGKILATKKGKYKCTLADDIYLNVEMGQKGVDITVNSYGYANQFEIYRSTSKNKGFKKIKTIYTPEYTDKTAKSGKTYWYKVKPKYYDSKTGKTVKGAMSEAVGIKALLGNVYSDFFEIKQASASSAKITWEKVGGASSYEIWYRCSTISGDKYKKAGTTKKTSYTLKNLKNGYGYSIKVKAIGSNNTENSYSNIISIGYKQSSDSTDYSGYISNLKRTNVTTKLSSNKKTLTVTTTLKWDRTWGATGYRIYAYDNYKDKTVKLATLKASKTTYKVNNVSSASKGARYSKVYVVPYRGKKEGNSSSSQYVESMPYAKKVRVSRKGTSNKIVWSGVAGASSYDVMRISAMGIRQQVGTTKGKSFIDKNVTPGMEYQYYVVCNTNFSGIDSSYCSYSYNSSNDKDVAEFEKFVGIKTYTQTVAAPAISKVSNSAKRTVTVKWKKVSGAKYYLVYRSTSKKGKYKQVKKTTALSCKNTKLKKGKTYYYKVKAVVVNDSGVAVQSSYSKVKSVKVKK